jgi:serine/threonine protein kinase
MPVKARPVNESIQEINNNSWVIGDRILLSRRRSPPSGSSWSDGKGSFYVISEAPYPLPPSRPLSATTHIEKVYDAGGVSAVWSIGDAFCKVKILDPDATREHVTLDYLHNKRPLSFATPDVYYHAEYDGRYYIVLSGLTGHTLTKAWPNMDEAMKQHYVSRVVKVCKELAVWQADYISGVDGRHLSETHLTRLGQPEDCSPQNLLTNCNDLGMDCSIFVLYHCDLGPGNIIVNLADGSIGIIDWETAGFVPREWIRTKFRISGGMDLPGSDQELRVDWRRRVQRRLGEEGFPDIAERWMVWWRNEG